MSDTLFDIDDLNCLDCGRPLLGNTYCVWCRNKERNLEAGIARKERGMTLAMTPDALNEWKAAFRNAVWNASRSEIPFTSEDILEVVGLPSGEIGQHANNAVGAMMNSCAKKGWIHKTGRHVPSQRPTSHGTEINEWTGTFLT
jgi:hypothetical protein